METELDIIHNRIVEEIENSTQEEIDAYLLEHGITDESLDKFCQEMLELIDKFNREKNGNKS